MEIQDYKLPDDLYSEEHHYWVKMDGNILVMGMDDFTQQMAGEIVYVHLPFEGKKLSAGWVKSFAGKRRVVEIQRSARDGSDNHQ